MSYRYGPHNVGQYGYKPVARIFRARKTIVLYTALVKHHMDGTYSAQFDDLETGLGLGWHGPYTKEDFEELE